MNDIQSIEILKGQFDLSARALSLNLDGISEEEGMVQPAAGGNCIHWILGHIVSSRQDVLGHLDREPVWSPELIERFRRGSDPIQGAADSPASLSDLYETFERSHHRVLRAFDQFRWDGDGGSHDKKLQEKSLKAVALLQFHESYHVGQIGLLRRIVGHPGAIE